MGFLKQRPAPIPIQEPAHRRLNSWKEIASYLDTSVRTVQRWEQSEGLPVRRHEHSGGGTVYAFTQELDEWLAGRATQLAGLTEPAGHRDWRRLGLLAAALAGAAALGLWVVPRLWRGTPVESLAVLPFANDGSDANTEYLSEGLPESITRGLARLPGFRVRVISHSAVERLRDQKLDAEKAGRLLNVQAVLTGKVTQRGEGLSVVVELVDVRDHTQIWGERFDRRMAEVLQLQEEIAREIAAKLHLRLSQLQKAEVGRQATESAEAHRNYLRGRYHWNRRTEQGLRQAIEYFQRAIAEDPAYALAYAGLAESYAVLSYYGAIPPKECAPKAIAAARRAIELDETVSGAWTALAHVESDNDWNWKAAEEHYRRALELDEGNASAHHWYSEDILSLGRFDEQKLELRRAAELDPLSPIITNNQGHGFYFSRRYAEAEQCYRRAMEEYPQFGNPHKDLAKVYLVTGRAREALAELERAKELGLPAMEEGLIGYAYARMGDAARARSLETKLAARAREAYVSPFTMAFISVGLNEKEKALEWLGRALEERSPTLKWISVDPMFDPLRGDARFEAMLRKMGLAGVAR